MKHNFDNVLENIEPRFDRYHKRMKIDVSRFYQGQDVELKVVDDEEKRKLEPLDIVR